ELFAFITVSQRIFVSPAGTAYCLPGHRSTGQAQHAGSITEAVSFLQAMLLLYPAIIQRNKGILDRTERHLVLNFFGFKAGIILLDNKALNVAAVHILRPDDGDI